MSIFPATFHVPWPLKLMHPMKFPFGSTTLTNNFQETQTYRFSYLPKNKLPGFHLLLTREARVGKISRSFPRNTLPKAALHVLLLLNFAVEFLATRKLDTTSYVFLPTASDPLFPVRGFTSLRSPVPGQQWPEPPFASLEVCRPAASLSPPGGPRDTYLFPSSVDRLSPSIPGRTLNSKAGCQPPKVPDGQGLRTQFRASSQLSLQACPVTSSNLDTAVSVRHLRAGQRCRGPTRPSVRPRKRPSP